MEATEAPATAASRELAEETGYEISASQLQIIGQIAPDSGSMNNTVPVAYGQVSTPIIPVRDGEVSEYKLVPIKDLLDFIKTTPVIDGFTLSAITLLRAHELV